MRHPAAHYPKECTEKPQEAQFLTYHPSRGRARSNRVPCASGARVHPTTDGAPASNAPAHCAIPVARDLLACCAIRISGLPCGVRVLRERLGADIVRGVLPERAEQRRKAEASRE